jgi:TP901 family phage tail tape measure protein
LSDEKYIAELGVNFSGQEQIDAAITALADFSERFPELSREAERAEKALATFSSSARNVNATSGENAKAIRDEADAFSAYADKLAEANRQAREFAKSKVTGETGRGIDPTTLSRGEQDQLLAIDNASRQTAISMIRDQRRAEDDLATAERRLLDAQRERAQADSDEAARQQKIASAFRERKRAAEELAKAEAALAKRAADDAAIKASNSAFGGDVGTRLGQPSTGMKASETSFAGMLRAEDLKASAQGGRDYANASVLMDAAIKRASQSNSEFTNTIRARMQAEVDGEEATRRMTEAAERQATTALPRLRYALYDVSQVLSILGVGMVAATAATVGTAAAFERDFADVRRTVGVTGEAADQLYDKFVTLSTQIPTSFADLTSIGALAGQLGVAENRVASFTKTVAMFSATTDVTVDASATAFGRLDQLIDGVNGRYDALGSAILNVGINSVATESSIINISSQIAATGDQAGLTADEIIGLSGSLASLGVAPEAARGTVLRTFSEINSAVSSGGTALADFASISGQSAEQFKASWGTEGGFTKTFIPFLEGIAAQGPGAEASLRALGISAQRDINTLLKMSQNAGDVSTNLELAQAGFTNTSILTENFGVIAETTSAKLQIFAQTFQALIASIGSGTSGVLPFFLDLLTGVTKAFIAINDNPIGSTITTILTVAGGLVGVMTLLVAISLRAAGSFLAVKQAISEMNAQAMVARGGIAGLGAAFIGAEGAMSRFRATLITTGIGALLVGVSLAAAAAITQIGEAMKSGRQSAEEYFGTLDGLGDAIKADNAAAFTAAAKAQQDQLLETARAGGGWADAMDQAAESQMTVEEQSKKTTDVLTAQTAKVGENTNEWIRNALMQSESFKKLFTQTEDLNRLQSGDLGLNPQSRLSVFSPIKELNAPKFDVQAFTDSLSSNGGEDAQKYIDAYVAKISELTPGVSKEVAKSMLMGNDAFAAAQEAATEVKNGLEAGLVDANLGAALGAALGQGLGEGVEDANVLSERFKGLMDDTYGLINAQNQLAGYTNSLGQEFVNSGAAVASNGSAMQQVIQGIFDSSSGAGEAAARMQGLFNALVQGGYASAQQLSGLQAVIAGLTGGKAVQAQKFDMKPFTQGMQKAQVAAAGKGGGGGGGAAKAIRTLVDYAGDLRKVFSRAFEIRFAASQGMDKITSQWSDARKAIVDANKDIAEAVEDTNDALRDYQTEMARLSSDKANTEYWLSVARSYGDTLREGELSADLAEIQDKISESAKGLAKTQESAATKTADAQGVLNKSLSGNSDEAIRNRAEILGLVGDYQEYVAQLAASGISQDELKRRTAQLKEEFLRQAEQLGYNRSELQTYARAFDDVTLAIQRVPKNVTVTGNVNPALQAIAELESKLSSLGGKSYAGPSVTSGNIDNGNIEKAARGMALIAAIDAEKKRQLLSTAPPGLVQREYLNSMVNKLNSGNYRSGGYTGPGRPWDEAGIVHRKEFVLNEQGARMLPMSQLNAMNQGRMPNIVRPVPVASGRGDGPVPWSEYDRQLIRELIDRVGIQIPGDAITAAATAGAVGNDRRRGA